VSEAPWYEGFFGESYLRAYRPVLAETDTAGQVNFVVRTLRLEPGMRVLDLCCGQGRHAVPLARRGLRVTGQDLSEHLLGEAGKAAEAAGAQVELVRSDMREIRWTSEFDAAINLFTAFGYFEDDRENIRVLEGVARALRPGGRFLIDLLNPAWLHRNWQSTGWSRGEDGLIVVEERRMDFARSIHVCDWTFIEADGRRRSATTRLRIIHPHEIAAWLHGAGMEPEALYGDFDGTPLGIESFRLITVARKG
jgi:SAM-dependent methyltransferase